MRRREFITMLGSAAAAWPVAARAQQSERVRRLGVLLTLAPDDPAARARQTELVQGLQQLGWVEGRNVTIELRWGGGAADRYRDLAAELVALAPDVLVTNSA